jgi:hypothetical protein
MNKIFPLSITAMKRFVRRYCWMSQMSFITKWYHGTINDTANNSELSSLSLLPRKELSGAQNGDTQGLAAYTYREEHMFIHSEIDNEDDNKDK